MEWVFFFKRGGFIKYISNKVIMIIIMVYIYFKYDFYHKIVYLKLPV